MRLLVLFAAVSVLMSLILEKKKWKVATAVQAIAFTILLWMFLMASDVPIIEQFALNIFGEDVVMGTKEIVNMQVEGIGIVPMAALEIAVILNLILLVCMATVGAVSDLAKQPTPNEIYFGTAPETDYKPVPVERNEHPQVEARYMFCVMLC